LAGGFRYANVRVLLEAMRWRQRPRDVGLNRIRVAVSDHFLKYFPDRIAIGIGRGSDLHFHWSDFGSQNAPVKPSELQIDTISSGAGRRDSTVSRFAYQWTASCHSCSRLISGRRGMLRAAHHALTVSSDRKRSIVPHVKMRLSHQCAAGTANCATYGFK